MVSCSTKKIFLHSSGFTREEKGCGGEQREGIEAKKVCRRKGTEERSTTGLVLPPFCATSFAASAQITRVGEIQQHHSRWKFNWSLSVCHCNVKQALFTITTVQNEDKFVARERAAWNVTVSSIPRGDEKSQYQTTCRASQDIHILLEDMLKGTNNVYSKPKLLHAEICSEKLKHHLWCDHNRMKKALELYVCQIPEWYLLIQKTPFSLIQIE